MKKLLFTLSFCFSAIGIAQVGVGTATPDASAQLEVVATDKGILIPRLNIIDLNTAAPVAVADIDESLLAYNTNAASGKGFYYWDGTKWAPLGGSSGLHSGTGVPTASNPAGADAGDIYVDEATGDVYTLDSSGTWVNQSDETLTKITSDASAGTITYTDEENKDTLINIAAIAGIHTGTGAPTANSPDPATVDA